MSGEPGADIELKINYPPEEIESRSFVLDGKRLRLTKPLDRDAKDLASIVFQVGPWCSYSVRPDWAIYCYLGEF